MRTTPQWKTDQFAWPVTLRVLIPENGFSEISPCGEYQPWTWLDAALGQTEYARTSRRTSLGDAVELHFRTLDDAQAFQRRFPQLVLADSTMGITYSSPHLPFGRRDLEEAEMCNLYSQTRSVDAMRSLFPKRPISNLAGNLEPQASIYPDQLAPVLRLNGGDLELRLARWGLPTPAQYLVGKSTDRGVTNVRNTRSPHWRSWLGPENRCLVPLDSFAEPRGRGAGNAWFSLRDGGAGFFAGLWVPEWTSVRKVRDGETTDDLYAFLTTEPNAEVAAIHPKAMPVLLTDPTDWDMWLTAPWAEASRLQQPLPDGILLVE